VGDGFCVSEPVDTGIDLLAADEVIEAAVSEDPDSATVVPTTTPDGTVVFLVKYPTTRSHNHTQDTHAHNVT